MLTRLVLAAADPPGSNGPATRRVPALAPLDRRALIAEFPTVEITLLDPGDGVPLVPVDADGWSEGRIDVRALDRRLEELSATGDVGIEIAAPFAEVARVAHEVLTRFQRFLGRRNRWSRCDAFSHLLARHRRLHDPADPLARADHAHGLDTWQWLLRLDPAATLAAQAAALFHDIERPRSAPEHPTVREIHARHAGEVVFAALGEAGAEPAVATRARAIVAAQARPGGDEEAQLLNEADALSFLSLRSEAFHEDAGPERTRRRVAVAIGKLRGVAHGHLRRIRFCPEVEAMVHAEQRTWGPADALVPPPVSEDEAERGYPPTVRVTREGAAR